MNAKSILAFAVFIIGFGLSASCQSDYRLPCLYIYKFSQHIKWPETTEVKEIVIGVYGISPIIPALEEFFKARSKGTIKYSIRKITTADGAAECDILFVTKERLSGFEKLVADLKGKSILIMSEVPGLGKKGACVNFLYGSGNDMKVEISKHCIESRGLKISTEALRFGVEI